MSNIQVTTDFQQRMFERIRDSMGDLLSDEDLKKLIDVALQKIFFEKQIDKSRSTSFHTHYGDSMLVDIIKELVQPAVVKAVNEWIAQNPKIVEQTIDTVVSQGITRVVFQHLDQVFSLPLQNLRADLRQKGINLHSY